MEKRLILASASPRRKELLERAGFSVTVIPSNCQEVITSSAPDRVVEELSFQKAEDVCRRMEPDCVVLGSDTVVALNGCIMGKPESEEDAFGMLQRLQGNVHQVYTGVTLMEPGGRRETFSCCTDVTVYPMTESEIWAYISTGEPMDKAGAYGIQGRFGIYVKEIRGDYHTVVGLPVSRVYQELKAFGVRNHD